MLLSSNRRWIDPGLYVLMTAPLPFRLGFLAPGSTACISYRFRLPHFTYYQAKPRVDRL